MWQRDGIGCKWAPMFLYGPRVSETNALEFIRRTDKALIGWPSTNARDFEEELENLLGFDRDDVSIERFQRQNHFAEAFGHIELEHLDSQRVASAYIFGPSGPVSKTGQVHMVKNFGKYPSIEEIEQDLTKIAAEFPWLSFHLYVWDSHDEKAEGYPDFGWWLSGGEWHRVTSLPTEERREPELSQNLLMSLFAPAEVRECTWTIDEIKEMWGDQIAKAREATACLPSIS